MEYCPAELSCRRNGLVASAGFGMIGLRVGGDGRASLSKRDLVLRDHLEFGVTCLEEYS